MSHSVLLRGYRYSVYNRIACVTLYEKGVSYGIEEVDPFVPYIPRDYLARHPFGRVPVLSHGGFDIFETSAIIRYVNAVFDGPDLVPDEIESQVRMEQVISILNSYGYRPMVRQVFAQRVFGPAEGGNPDETEIAAGLEASQVVLAALNKIAAEGKVLDRRGFTLADCYLAPMMSYFTQAPEGAEALASCSALAEWWAFASNRDSLEATDPGLPGV